MQSKIAELLHQYFELGIAEGREGRNHDTEAGDAQRVLSEIEAEIAALPAAEPVSYQRKTVYGWREVDAADIPHYRSVGQEIRPLYAAPPAPSVAVKAKPDGYLTPTMPGESWHSWKSCAISEPGARPFYFSPAMANTEWKELDDAFSNFINCYGDTFKPKRNHEKETERNVKALSKAFDAARSALSGSRQSAQAVVVKALRWDEFSTELKRHFQSSTILGQYQIAYLGEFECWQLYSPQKSSTWKENFSRHKSSDEAKAAAQADYEARIRSALSAQVQDVAESKQLELNVTKEWFEKRAALEGDHEIGAGRRKLTASIDPTPEELAELYRIAHRIPEGWQLVPKEPTEEMKDAAYDEQATRFSAMEPEEIYRAMLAVAPAKQEGGHD